MEQIIELANHWERDGVISSEQALLVYKMLEPYLEHEFDQINQLTEESPEEALGVLIKTTNFVSAAGGLVPGVVTKLQKSIRKYQGHAHQLGQKLGAENVTISVGFPSGVTLGLTWNT